MASSVIHTTAHERGLLAAARGGDELAFQSLVAPRRGELHAHCYRMLGSVHVVDAADAGLVLRAADELPA